MSLQAVELKLAQGHFRSIPAGRAMSVVLSVGSRCRPLAMIRSPSTAQTRVTRVVGFNTKTRGATSDRASF